MTNAELPRLGSGARKGDHRFKPAFGAIHPHFSSTEEVVLVAKGSAGQVLERRRKGGTIYALRFRAYGERHYQTLGGETEGWTRSRARAELKRVMADVERGVWASPLRRSHARRAVGPRGAIPEQRPIHGPRRSRVSHPDRRT